MTTLAAVVSVAGVPTAATARPTLLSSRMPSRGSWCRIAGISGRWVDEPHNSWHRLKRSVSACATSKDAEKSFQKTVEVDRLIDMLRDSSSKELEKLIVENILSFDESFWIRLAARSDTCKSDDDKKDYEELATSVMSIVERVVHKTRERRFFQICWRILPRPSAVFLLSSSSESTEDSIDCMHVIVMPLNMKEPVDDTDTNDRTLKIGWRGRGRLKVNDKLKNSLKP